MHATESHDQTAVTDEAGLNDLLREHQTTTRPIDVVRRRNALRAHLARLAAETTVPSALAGEPAHAEA